MTALRFIFAGTPDFAAHILAALLQANLAPVAVYTQPDRPAGRGRKLCKSPVKVLAEAHQLPVYQPLKLKDKAIQNELNSWQADVMIVAAYGLILPKAILEMFPYGCINVHASLLPRWRGAAPIQHAILAGDKASGISMMQMDVGLDTGNIISLHPCLIQANDTGETLHQRLSEIAAKALIDSLLALNKGNLISTAQDNSLATYAHKLSKETAVLNWHQTAIALERQVRAFNPWPVAFIELNQQPLRIWQALALNHRSEATPGTVLEISKNGIDIACGQGVLRLLVLQRSGGKKLPVAEFIKGQHLGLELGLIL